jgi:hypothetical protein
MSRKSLSRAALLCVSLMMVFSLLVACGGDDDDGGSGGGGDFPVPSGADKLGEDEASADDLDTADMDIANGKMVAYKVEDSSFDDVAKFYEDAEDGWEVDNHVAIGGFMLSVMHNGKDLAVTTVMSGADAREQGGADLEDLDINLDDLGDDDILIFAAMFTCNEDSIDTCVEAMDLGL